MSRRVVIAAGLVIGICVNVAVYMRTSPVYKTPLQYDNLNVACTLSSSPQIYPYEALINSVFDYRVGVDKVYCSDVKYTESYFKEQAFKKYLVSWQYYANSSIYASPLISLYCLTEVFRKCMA